MDDSLVAQFTAITSTDPERAAQYLRLTDGNFEQAVQLFFDSPALDFDSAAPARQPAGSVPQPASVGQGLSGQASRYREDEDGVVHIDSDEDLSANLDLPDLPEDDSRPAHHPAYQDTEDDEAMARRLQEELYGGPEAAGFMGEGGIRAPMARTTETLVGPDADWGPGSDDLRAAVAEQMLARQRRQQQHRPGIFNQRATPASVWDDAGADSDSRRRNLSRATAGASEASAKSSHLAELYRPPFEIISRLSWDEAREEGKDGEKWILVNVQDPAIFDCQVLNRDIWKHAQIKDTVKENFIFMQYAKDDPRGNQYMQYYFQSRDSHEAYPHIAIVDPRTGEQVKVWSGPPVPKPMDFLMQLHEFLDRYSLNPNARNPVATRKPERKKELDVHRMTEEEMMEMALQNSLANDGGTRDQDPDELTSKPETPGKGKGKVTSAAGPSTSHDTALEIPNGATPSPSKARSPFSLISAARPHTEPPNDPATTTRIQFRYSGGRQIRRFAISDPVRRIYEWLKASPLESREGMEFELIFMGKNLIDMVDMTIEQAGLKNGTVMVEFVEE